MIAPETIIWDELEPGCYVDGHWGIYAIQHLADQFPDVVKAQDRMTLRMWGSEYATDDIDELYHELGSVLEERINERLPENQVAHWWEGEFFISPWCGRDHMDSAECVQAECYCHCD